MSEVLALRWEDLNLEGLLPTLTVLHGKGGQGRVIRLSNPLRETLVELQPAAARAEDLVFATRTGRPLARNNVWTSLRRTARAGRHRARHQPALVPARPRQPRPRRRRPRPVRQGDAGPRLAGHHLDLRPRPQRRRQRPVAGLRHTGGPEYRMSKRDRATSKLRRHD